MRGGGGSGGGGEDATPPPIRSEADLMRAIERLDSDDRVVIKVQGMPTVVIDGKDAGHFFSDTFRKVTSLLTAAADGRLEAAMPNLPEKIRVAVQDFMQDMRGALDKAHFVRFSNTDNLAGEVPPGHPTLDPDERAFYDPTLRNDASNLNGDAATIQFHQVFFDSSKFGAQMAAGQGRAANASNRQYDTLGVTIFHELLHIREGEETRDAEFIKLGVPESTPLERLANHDPVFDEAGLHFMKLARKFDFDLTMSANASFDQIRTGGDGSDSISLYVGPGEIATIDSLGGDDAISLNFSESVVATGAGNDTLTQQAGRGRLMWHDASGNDTLVLASATSLADVAVECLGD